MSVFCISLASLQMDPLRNGKNSSQAREDFETLSKATSRFCKYLEYLHTSLAAAPRRLLVQEWGIVSSSYWKVHLDD